MASKPSEPPRRSGRLCKKPPGFYASQLYFAEPSSEDDSEYESQTYEERKADINVLKDKYEKENVTEVQKDEKRDAVFKFFNEATKRDLLAIRSCGEKTAKKILDKRPFQNFQDIKSKIETIRGIKKEMLNPESFLAVIRIDYIKSLLKGIEKNPSPKDIVLLEKTAGVTVGPMAKMTEFQKKGLNRLINWDQSIYNGILADESGLGKTIQVISFLAYLKEDRVRDIQAAKLPHLIIVSTNSSIAKWKQEFSKWCPNKFKVLCYYGSKDERKITRQEPDVQLKYDVILTTQAMVTGITADRNFFSNLKFHYIIFAQGRGKWPLKNFEIFKEIPASKKLLLTSNDPMQYKNLVEIMPLLYYSMPNSFDGEMNMKRLNNILSMYPSQKYNERNGSFFEDKMVETAKKILKPFVFRRLKSDSNVKNDLRQHPDFPWSIDEACKIFPTLKNVSLDYNKLVSYDLFKDTYKYDILENNPGLDPDDNHFEILMKAKWREFEESGTCGGSGRFSNSSLNKDGGEYLHIIWIISI